MQPSCAGLTLAALGTSHGTNTQFNIWIDQQRMHTPCSRRIVAMRLFLRSALRLKVPWAQTGLRRQQLTPCQTRMLARSVAVGHTGDKVGYHASTVRYIQTLRPVDKARLHLIGLRQIDVK